MRTADQADGMTVLPPLTRNGAGEWRACRDADIRAVLADPRFAVPEAGPGGPEGTVTWLRASVSRFANGAEHQRRRGLVIDELRRISPDRLRPDARHRAARALAGAGRPGAVVDVMSVLARRVPAAALAAGLSLADPVRAAEAVPAVAAAYFPGAGAEAERRADAATAWLAGALREVPGPPAGPELIAARIALMVQACEATAGLIGSALHRLQDAQGGGLPGPAGWPTEALLAETLRHSPPLGASRRVARVAASAGGAEIGAGETVVCDIDAGGRDPAVFSRPGCFDPGRAPQATLAFGHGIRPCPGQAHALALAAGVTDAVRDHCVLRGGTAVTYEPSPVSRVPQRLEVTLA
jgi:cytochrome P450